MSSAGDGVSSECFPLEEKNMDPPCMCFFSSTVNE
jgi:hypothetical protein